MLNGHYRFDHAFLISTYVPDIASFGKMAARLQTGAGILLQLNRQLATKVCYVSMMDEPSCSNLLIAHQKIDDTNCIKP